MRNVQFAKVLRLFEIYVGGFNLWPWSLQNQKRKYKSALCYFESHFRPLPYFRQIGHLIWMRIPKYFYDR